MKNTREIEELDRIKTKDGRVGTVMLIMRAPNGKVGLCVEFDDKAPKTETVELVDVSEII